MFLKMIKIIVKYTTKKPLGHDLNLIHMTIMRKINIWLVCTFTVLKDILQCYKGVRQGALL